MMNLLCVGLSAELDHSIAFFDIKDFRNIQVSVCCDLVCFHEEEPKESSNSLVAHLENLMRKQFDLLA